MRSCEDGTRTPEESRKGKPCKYEGDVFGKAQCIDEEWIYLEKNEKKR